MVMGLKYDSIHLSILNKVFMCCVETDSPYFFELRLVIVIEYEAFSTMHDPFEARGQCISGPDSDSNVAKTSDLSDEGSYLK